jgi:hypothetical protein
MKDITDILASMGIGQHQPARGIGAEDSNVLTHALGWTTALHSAYRAWPRVCRTLAGVVIDGDGYPHIDLKACARRGIVGARLAYGDLGVRTPSCIPGLRMAPRHY